MFRSNRRGLTPSETLLIAAIVAAFALMLAWRFAGDPAQEGRRLTIERMNAVMDALDRYAIDSGGVFPTTEQGLAALGARPTADPVPVRWEGAYVADERLLADAWGSPFQYVSPGGDERIYDLWSNGADRAERGDGADADIQSWNRSTLIP